ncbi:hypothetical protein AVEN_136794-1 [Araneus ventricosus]|uniref:Uncharacterized protein n=1 Tax=Araneus ventricosus TaxID=182803 RepID=A0A4Y2MZ24_ARAVE|nr:hypothetical protein AVEN_136794-1 [Araneus ventricosus]
MGPPHAPLSRESATHLRYLDFAFLRKARSPLPTIIFQFYGQRVEWETGPDENQNISITQCQFSSDFGFDDGFWIDALQMVWSGAVVNVQLNI